MGALGNALDFVLTTLFQLYITVVLLRLLLQWARADFYNPLSQFVVKVTSPLVNPLRRVLPGWGGIDTSSLLLAYGLTVTQVFLVGTHISPYEIPGLLDGSQLGVVALLLVSLVDLIALAISIFVIAIIIQAIISWVNPGTYNPVVGVLHSITEPLLRPARRLIPPVSGIDLSPLLVLIVLHVAKMLFVQLLLG